MRGLAETEFSASKISVVLVFYYSWLPRYLPRYLRITHVDQSYLLLRKRTSVSTIIIIHIMSKRSMTP
jgi:hypothetical protein